MLRVRIKDTGQEGLGEYNPKYKTWSVSFDGSSTLEKYHRDKIEILEEAVVTSD